MGASIVQAQEDARRLVRNVKMFAPNVNFAIVQFRDKGDTPEYKIEQTMTADPAAVETAVNRLAAGKTFRFCIRLQDPSGNRSGWSRARVKLA